MPNILENLIENVLSRALRIWELLTGSPDYQLQESKVRIPDPRRVVYVNNQLRRTPHSGLDCDRHWR